MQHKNALTLFLRQLADLVENDKMNGSQMRCIGEFYMSYLFKEELKRESGTTRKRTTNCNHMSSHSKKEMQKFIFLGWYVYNKILNNESL